ncbi:UNVERIFIED_CONTAM: multiple sugar transport system substrate-binding protein [Acetivibrio alkalicellulosi]
MKKKLKLIILLTTIISLCFSGGCANNSVESIVENNNTVSPNDSKSNEKTDIELEIWGWFSFGETLKNFQLEHKNIKVTEKLFSFSQCEEEYMRALASGKGPDIFVFDSSFFGQYTVNNVLQDLLEEPFSADKYKDDFLGWNSGFSIDGDQLLSITFSTAPYVTIYRADIMEENGFPSDPDEFGNFIKNPENILKIANTLQEKNQYIFQYPTDLTDIARSTLGYFDNDLNFVEYDDFFIKSLDISRAAYRNELILNKNFWSEEGKQAILDDSLVMLFTGSYTIGTLARYAPEQAGKWRVAKAPLGMKSWASDTRLSINRQSKHQEAAWRLVEYILTHQSGYGAGSDVVSGYIPIHSYVESLEQLQPYLGNQQICPLLRETATNMFQYKLTPMDSKALSIYRSAIWSFPNSNLSSEDIVKNIKKEVENELIEEKNALLR